MIRVNQKLGLFLILSALPGLNLSAQDTISRFGGYTTLDEALSATSQPLMYDGKGAIRLEGDVSAQSNGVPYDFYKSFVFPDFISEDQKRNALEELDEKTRFGAIASWKAQVIFATDSASRAQEKYLSVRVRQNTIYSTQFGKDAFRLLFEGNKPFAGIFADLSKTSIYFTSYRTFELGYVFTKPKAYYSIHLGLASGNNLQQLDIQSGSLFTAEDGSYLDLDWKGDFFFSAMPEKGIFDSKAIGATMSLDFTQLLGNKWILSESITDLGFIVWNPKGRAGAQDTSFRFTGIQLGNLLEISDSSIVLGDTLEQKLIGNDVRQSKMAPLPFHLSLGLERSFVNRWSAGVRLDYRYIPGFRPMAGLMVRKGFGKQRSLRAGFSYGGFGNFQSFADATVFSNHRHSLNIGTVFNEGFVSKKNSGNLGIRLIYIHHI